jgi:predicted Zn-dependent peptidase
MLLRPRLEGLDIERRIILEEASEDLNEHGRQISPDNLTAALLWPDSSLGKPTIGTRQTITAIDRQDLIEHHRRYYTPGNTVIAVSGRVGHDEVLTACNRHFAAWQGDPVPPPSPGRAEPDPGLPESSWVHDSDSQITMQLVFRLPGRRAPHAVPLRLLRRILSWGGTSRLMLHLRERLGLTYHVEANLTLYDECGCLGIDLAVAPENAVTALHETLVILEDLCREPVPDEELQRMVQGYLFDLDFSRDHPDDPAVRYGWGTLVGYLRTLAEDRREMTATTAADLLTTARELLVPGALKAAVVGPWRPEDREAMEARLHRFRQ